MLGPILDSEPTRNRFKVKLRHAAANIAILFAVAINTFRSLQSHVFENKHISKTHKITTPFSCPC